MSSPRNSLLASHLLQRSQLKQKNRGDGDKKLAVECSALHVNGGVGWAAEGEFAGREEETKEGRKEGRKRKNEIALELGGPAV